MKFLVKTISSTVLVQIFVERILSLSIFVDTMCIFKKYTYFQLVICSGLIFVGFFVNFD